MSESGTVADSVALTVRPCTAEDVDAVLELVRADEERVSGLPSRLVAGDLRDWWQSVDLAANSWLVTAPNAPTGPVAVAWLDQPGGDLAVAYPIASPDRAGALDLLVDLVERRAGELGAARLHVAVLVPDPLSQAVVEGRGYAEVRRFYEMAIELAGRPEELPLPEHLSLTTATPDDAPAFHRTISEAFEDHWEHHPLSFDEWWARRTADPEFDISWWFTVRVGEQTVAAIRNVPARNGGVYVASLGVRRPWRGRGLAKSLLQHTFAKAWDAGWRRVTLGVDATNPTGATALYRSVGMVSELETAVWEKHLSPAEPH